MSVKNNSGCHRFTDFLFEFKRVICESAAINHFKIKFKQFPEKTFSFLFLFLFSSALINAQRATVSPYSRYGIGELPPLQTVQQAGLGGIGNAIYAGDRVNFINPASYAFDTITTFEAGIKGEISNLETSSNSQTANGVNLSYLAFAFPVIKNKWGASIGLMPYS